MKPMFAAFMAGAVVVGGLMFMSDKMNLFGYDAQTVQSGVAQLLAAAGCQTGIVSPTGTTVFQIAKAASPAIVKIETKVKQTKNGRIEETYAAARY